MERFLPEETAVVEGLTAWRLCDGGLLGVTADGRRAAGGPRQKSVVVYFLLLYSTEKRGRAEAGLRCVGCARLDRPAAGGDDDDDDAGGGGGAVSMSPGEAAAGKGGHLNVKGLSMNEQYYTTYFRCNTGKRSNYWLQVFAFF